MPVYTTARPLTEDPPAGGLLRLAREDGARSCVGCHRISVEDSPADERHWVPCWNAPARPATWPVGPGWTGDPHLRDQSLVDGVYS